jgi:methyltransferase
VILCYLSLVALVALQRLAETARSRRAERLLREQGAQEFGARHFPLMVALHGMWLIACAGEAWWLQPEPPHALLAVIMLLLLVAGQTLRFLAMRALGPRWTARVMVLPDAPLIESGIFTRFRHPNYLGVVVEIAALPLIWGCWRTALVFSLANGLLLKHRIAVEEEALGG